MCRCYNGAGVAYPYGKSFHEVDWELVDALIRMNMEGTTWVRREELMDP